MAANRIILICAALGLWLCISSVPARGQDAVAAVGRTEFDQSCANGSGEACRLRGRLLMEGQGGVRENDTEALRSYEAGCALNDVEACALIGYMAWTGQGMPTSAAVAVRQYITGCRGGIEFACSNLSIIRNGGSDFPGNALLASLERPAGAVGVAVAEVAAPAGATATMGSPPSPERPYVAAAPVSPAPTLTQSLSPGLSIETPPVAIIYFGYEEPSLTAHGRQLLDTFVEEYRLTGQSEAVVSGHNDRAEGDASLAQRRANVVRDYLASMGIPAAGIMVQSFGEERPWVETSDGVREPDNRRVEVTAGPGSGW